MKILDNNIIREMTTEETIFFTNQTFEESKDNVIGRLEKLENLFDKVEKLLKVEDLEV